MRSNPHYWLTVDVEVDKNRHRVFEQSAPHPFIQTNIRPKGIRMALAVLFGRVTWHVSIAGTPEALRVIREGKYELPTRGHGLASFGQRLIRRPTS